MSVILEELERYLAKRQLRGVKHLAALVAALGAERVAADSGLPQDWLARLHEEEPPPGGFAVIKPQTFRLGLAYDAAAKAITRRRFRELSASRHDAWADLPDEIEVPLPPVTEETNQGGIGSCVAWATAHTAEDVVAGRDGDAEPDQSEQRLRNY